MSILNKIKKAIKRRERPEFTLMGSIIWSVGAISSKEHKDCIKLYNFYKKNQKLFKKDASVADITDMVIEAFNTPSNMKDYIVLIYDKRGIYSPTVGIEFCGKVIPPSKDGKGPAIYHKLYNGDDDIVVERIYQ